MPEAEIAYKCPNCGATLTYSAKDEKMKCEYCDSVFDVETLEEYDRTLKKEEDKSEPTWEEYHASGTQEENTLFNCQSCGAQLLTDANTVATICPYCGGATVLAGRVSGNLLPDLVIPFKIDINDAKARLKTYCKGKILLPKNFMNDQRLESVTGLYVPFWLFDAKADAESTYNATRVHAYRRGDYNITETMHYLVRRAGEAEFERIPVDGSVKMDDAYMEAIEPFDYKDAVDFATAYLSGYLADKYDVDSKAAMPRANERIKGTASTLLRETVHGYSSVTQRYSHVDLSEGRIRYALLPVWMLSTKYKNETYQFAVNGQTGKLVGKLPVSEGRFWGLTAAIAGAITAIGTVLAFFI